MDGETINIYYCARFSDAVTFLFSWRSDSMSGYSNLGLVINASANKNLDNAYSNKAKSQEAIEGMRIIETLCNALTIRADMFTALLKTLNANLNVLIDDSEQVIEKSGTDYSFVDLRTGSSILFKRTNYGTVKLVTLFEKLSLLYE